MKIPETIFGLDPPLRTLNRVLDCFEVKIMVSISSAIV